MSIQSVGRYSCIENVFVRRLQSGYLICKPLESIEIIVFGGLFKVIIQTNKVVTNIECYILCLYIRLACLVTQTTKCVLMVSKKQSLLTVSHYVGYGCQEEQGKISNIKQSLK